MSVQRFLLSTATIAATFIAASASAQNYVPGREPRALGDVRKPVNTYQQPTGATQQGPVDNSLASPANTAAAPAEQSSLDPAGGGSSGLGYESVQVKEQNGVRYVSGGVGDEELAELKSIQNQFNLKLLLSTPSGAYISMANVQLLDSKGTSFFSINDGGPYIYFKLPAGTYTVNVTFEGGETKSQRVNVTSSGLRSIHLTTRGE